ncbi:MAG TPA: hypothetical protein VEG38_04450 [Acidimicrobiia bacterium]|nr:hypothetical protein [Acidimicrobiia bacterium]
MSAVGRAQGGAFEGEALVVWARAGTRPVFLAALHHTASPFGPFVEIVAGEFRSRPGLRPRLRQRTLAMSGGPAAKEALAEAATVKWWADEPHREVRWEERGFALRAEARRVAVPAIVRSDLLHPGWAGAERESARRLPAKVHFARIEIEVPGDDGQLARFAGRRPGFLVTTASQIGGEAWLHLVRTLRAPAVAEPA